MEFQETYFRSIPWTFDNDNATEITYKYGQSKLNFFTVLVGTGWTTSHLVSTNEC